jgi:hypothetical protein
MWNPHACYLCSKEWQEEDSVIPFHEHLIHEGCLPKPGPTIVGTFRNGSIHWKTINAQ